MSELKLEFVSKKVKDMYGTFIGKVVGIITDIEGSIESVSVDCGSTGIKNLPYEQLLVQGDYVIFIPRWRLDAQKLLREKSLTLKRIRALQEIVADNDSMKDDAELVYLKYEKRLDNLTESTKEIIDRLQQRILELEVESKRIKSILFDAKLQYKSNEITDDIYQQISLHTSELTDHISLEKNEINNIINKLNHQTLENTVAASFNKEQPTANENKETETEQNQIPQEIANDANINREMREEEIKKELENSIRQQQQEQQQEEVQEEAREEVQPTIIEAENNSSNRNEQEEVSHLIATNS
jgi:hypothetical protein